jgi:hypothetical protein
MVGRQRDGALGLLPDPVVVHVAHDLHRETLRRRDEAVREGQRRLAAGGGRRRCGAEALELALGERTEHHDAVSVAGRDRRGRVADRRRAASTAATPLHVGEAQLGKAERGGQARGIVTVVAVRREAVDLSGIDSGVFARGENRAERELHLGLGRLAVLVVRGLADACHRHATSDRSHAGILFRIWYGGL